MANIFELSIRNFRGIKRFDQRFGFKKLICLVGRGDSRKSTILEAISLALSPRWNPTILDTDFYNCDVENQIEIEASLFDFPYEFMTEFKFFEYLRFLDKDTLEIQDKLIENAIPILTLKFIVDKELEPKWYIISGREKGMIEIRSKDREKLNMYFISDYIDNHFNWNKGTPLYKLLINEDSEEATTEENIILKSLRKAKELVDQNEFEELQNVTKNIAEPIQSFGINVGEIKNTIDAKDILVKDGKITLHKNKIPYRMFGKGTRRIISLAIQMQLTKNGGITLVDEIEQGLEPDRIKHLIRTLICKYKGQLFITTHSRQVIEELDCDNFLQISNVEGMVSSKFIPEEDVYQKIMRSCPEALYAKRVIVCEGKTEIGICRAIEAFKFKNGGGDFTSNDVVYIDGNGDNFPERAFGLKELGFDVCVFCDSDKDDKLKISKEDLIKKDIVVFDTEKGLKIEEQFIYDLPWESVLKIVENRIKEKNNDENAVLKSIESKFEGELPKDWKLTDDIKTRTAIAASSIVNKKEWFKTIRQGEFIGEICCSDLEEFKDKKTGSNILGIIDWVKNGAH